MRGAPGPVLGGHSQSLAEDGSGPEGPNPTSLPCTGCVAWAGDTSRVGLSPPIFEMELGSRVHQAPFSSDISTFRI